MKIAEAQTRPPEKKPVSHALRSMAVGVGGGALGYGAAQLLTHNMKFFNQPNADKAKAVKIILPILSGTSAILADRYRKRLNDEYSKTRGYEGQK